MITYSTSIKKVGNSFAIIIDKPITETFLIDLGDLVILKLIDIQTIDTKQEKCLAFVLIKNKLKGEKKFITE